MTDDEIQRARDEVTRIAREHVPDALRGLIELMRTGKPTIRKRTARDLKKRFALVRQIMPDKADAIAAEIERVLRSK